MSAHNPESDVDSTEEGEDGQAEDIALTPNDAADAQDIVDRKIPKDIRKKYEVFSYRNAAVILAETRQSELNELFQALRAFQVTTTIIRTAGGNESDIPKAFSRHLRPQGWHETTIKADLIVSLAWREPTGKTRSGKPEMERRERTITREKYLDGHKIDSVKNKVAFDLEWNSKDQTFDRDLYAMNAFFLSGAIDAGVLVTRSGAMDAVFRSVGPALKKNGEVEMKSGQPRPTIQKYGASTTWMGKLLYRLNAGRNGGCPILAFGIKPAAVIDWQPPETSK
jgi:hypothetical protein